MEEFKPKRKNNTQPVKAGQNTGRAPQQRRPRAPKPQGENAAAPCSISRAPASRARQPLPPQNNPPCRASRPRGPAARARAARTLPPCRIPPRAPSAAAATRSVRRSPMR